jgi:hypothetical protein
MKFISLFCVVFAIGILNLKAHDNDNDTINRKIQSNTINFSAGFYPIWGVLSFNYERKIKEMHTGFFKTYYIKGSGGKWSTFGGDGIHTGIGLSGLTGRKSNHFEMHIGITSIIQTERYHREKDNPDNFPNQQPVLLKNYIGFWPAGTLGYRFQKPGKPFLFRTGIGFPEAVYLGLGMAF